MIKVHQTNLSKERGDCQRAAVASLFNLEISQVPNFRLFEDDKWWNVFCSFIWGIGYEIIDVITDVRIFVGTSEGLLLASIHSDYGDGYSHQVIIDTDGIIKHDPLPHSPNDGRDIVNEGILEDWYLITKRSTFL